jgi:hypothetical protein
VREPPTRVGVCCHGSLLLSPRVAAAASPVCVSLLQHRARPCWLGLCCASGRRARHCNVACGAPAPLCRPSVLLLVGMGQHCVCGWGLFFAVRLNLNTAACLCTSRTRTAHALCLRVGCDVSWQSMDGCQSMDVAPPACFHQCAFDCSCVVVWGLCWAGRGTHKRECVCARAQCRLFAIACPRLFFCGARTSCYPPTSHRVERAWVFLLPRST